MFWIVNSLIYSMYIFSIALFFCYIFLEENVFFKFVNIRDLCTIRYVQYVHVRILYTVAYQFKFKQFDAKSKRIRIF